MLELPFISSALIIALVPFVFVLMTSFTRISIVLTFLRQALSTSVPSAQIIIGLSLILTAYIMHPVITEIYDDAITPYMEQEEKKPDELLKKAWPPLRNFMLYHTREKDLHLFLDLGRLHARLFTLSPLSHHRYGGHLTPHVDGNGPFTSRHDLVPL